MKNKVMKDKPFLAAFKANQPYIQPQNSAKLLSERYIVNE